MKITIIYKDGTKYKVNLNVTKVDKFETRTYLFYESPEGYWSDTISFTNEFVREIRVG
jgi:hypothetical protein